MQVERAILETDESGRLKSLPPLPPRERIEAIFLALDTADGKPVRTPHPELAATTKIRGDLVAPAFDEEDWEALQWSEEVKRGKIRI
jgi:hypothetical protein